MKKYCLILFVVAAVLFFGIVYPHHLHYQEQYQLFLFDYDYLISILSQPGGVADLFGRFCTQFFLFAWVGAVIVGLLLMAIQAITACLFDCGRFYGLTFLPSCLLWIFLLDENALMGGIWSVLLTLLSMWGWKHISVRWLRLSMLALAVPLLYWAVGPISLLFFFYVLIVAEHRTLWALAAIVMLLIAPYALQHYISVPLQSFYCGAHYYRTPGETPVMLLLSVFSYVLLAGTDFLTQRWGSKDEKPVVVLLSVFAMLAIQGVLLWQNTNVKAETTMSYDFMARFHQWNRIVETANVNSPKNSLSATALNLALAKKGMLAERMFEYPQNGMSGLVPPFERDAITSLTTAEVFYQLGLINTAQHYCFEAQEAILDFQKSGRCYKRLAETNLINGHYEVARKYLSSLQKTLFYSDWANETMRLLGDEQAINDHPEYGALRKLKIRDNEFFIEREVPLMLERLLSANHSNRMAFEYLEASLLLVGDLDNFARFLGLYKELGYTHLPKHFQEAYALLWSRDHNNGQMPPVISQSVAQSMNNFFRVSSMPNMSTNALTRQFGNTYWYYFLRKNEK